MLTDILWSLLIIAVYYKVFIKLVKMGKRKEAKVELDFFEDEISK